MAKASLSVGTKVWAEKINAALGRSVEGYLEAGRILLDAKAAVPKGDFQRMIERDLRIDARSAQRLMVVARDPRLATNSSHLPAALSTLYDLAGLDDDTLAEAIKSGVINPKMTRRELPKPAPKIIEADYTELPPAIPYQAEEAVSVPQSREGAAASTADADTSVTDDREGGEAVVTDIVSALAEAIALAYEDRLDPSGGPEFAQFVIAHLATYGLDIVFAGYREAA